MKRKSIWQLSIFIFVVLAAWIGYSAWSASRNLVTLDVRNMDVRAVIKKLERQTRETIIPDENVQGKVTFRVRRVPLAVVLDIIDEQVSARWSVIYPLYSTGGSLERLKKALRGEADPAMSGWTNLQNRGFFGFGGRGGGPGGGSGGAGFGGFGGPGGNDPLSNQNERVSLEIRNKDLQFATLALGRYAQTRVVPEDGTAASINVKFNQTKVDTAVAKIAKQARRNWTRLYALRGDRDRDRDRRGPPGQLASADTSEPRRFDEGDRRGRDWLDLTPEQRDERRKQREALEEELKQTLPPETRQAVEQAQQQREQQFQEMQNLTPDQRRERFAQMRGFGGGARDTRMMSRIKNSTPEQRLARYQRMEQRRLRWQQQGGPGPGRFGR